MTNLEASKKSERISPEVIVGSSLVGVPLLLTAVRCTLQYVLVPFVLPIVGIQGSFSPVVNMAVSFFGLAIILYNLKRLWKTTWRKRYLLLSLVIIPFVLLSLYIDYLAYLEI